MLVPETEFETDCTQNSNTRQNRALVPKIEFGTDCTQNSQLGQNRALVPETEFETQIVPRTRILDQLCACPKNRIRDTNCTQNPNLRQIVCLSLKPNF